MWDTRTPLPHPNLTGFKYISISTAATLSLSVPGHVFPPPLGSPALEQVPVVSSPQAAMESDQVTPWSTATRPKSEFKMGLSSQPSIVLSGQWFQLRGLSSVLCEVGMTGVKISMLICIRH